MTYTPFFSTSCPSCGALVNARSATAVTLVCEYCNSMLVRQDDALIDSGRDAALLEDFSPLQIGTMGVFAGKTFSLVGRLQVHYEEGAWNEWYALFSDGTAGWLAEVGDLYAFTIASETSRDAPEFADIRAGFSRFSYQNKNFIASDVREITLKQSHAQGELPFAITQEMPNRVADFRCENIFLTLDYADDSPSVFIGRMVKLSDLNLSNTRTDDQIRESAGRLKGTRHSENCPNCGSSVHWITGLSTHLICPSCTSQINVSEDKAQLIQANTQREAQQTLFTLPIGAQGMLNGVSYYVMGAVRYSEMDAQDTFDTLFSGKPRTLTPEGLWTEYLLYNTQKGFAWLVATEEEWMISETLTEWPRLDSNGNPQGSKHLYDYGGKVEVAAGAFYWHIRSGDLNYYSDFAQGNAKLCAERNANELAWSRSKPIAFNQIAKSFLGENAPKYTAKMKADGISGGLRALLAGVFIIINLPAWLSMDFDTFMDDSFIFSFVTLSILLKMGTDNQD